MGFYQCHTGNFVLLEKRETGNLPANPSLYLQQKEKMSIIIMVPSAGEQVVNMPDLVMVGGFSV